MRRIQPGKVSDAYQDLMVEIAILKKLNHPNVIQLFEVIDDPENDKLFLGKLWWKNKLIIDLVLEYVKGGQVMTLNEQNEPVEPLGIEKSWKYFRDLIHGLNYRMIYHKISLI